LIRICYSALHKQWHSNSYNSLAHVNTIVVINQSQIHSNQSNLYDTFFFIFNELGSNKVSNKLVNQLFSTRITAMKSDDSIYIEYLVFHPNVLRKLLQACVNRWKKSNHMENSISIFSLVIEAVWHEFLSKNSFSNLIGVGCDGVIAKLSKKHGVQVFEVAHGIPTVESQDFVSLFQKSVPTYYLTWDSTYCSNNEGSSPQFLNIGYPKQVIPTCSVEHKNGLVLFGLTYDTKFEIDPWGILTKETDKAIQLLLSENFRISVRLHPMSIKNIGIGRKSKPNFNTIKKYLLQRYPRIESISDPFSVSLYSDIDNSSVVVSSGSLALNAMFRGKVAIVFDSPSLVPYVPDFFWDNGCIRKIKFEDFDLLPKIVKNTKNFSPPMTSNSKEFIRHLSETRLEILPRTE
jgi:hypothetical protein